MSQRPLGIDTITIREGRGSDGRRGAWHWSFIAGGVIHHSKHPSASFGEALDLATAAQETAIEKEGTA